MSTVYGLPYFLEDRTGSLTSSDYTDINGRLVLTLRPTAPHRNAYMIFSDMKFLATLDFGVENTLGTVSFVNGRSEDVPVAIPMSKYLVKTANSSRARKFTASDGQEYFWSRNSSTREWVCTNSSQYLVASYTDSLNPEHAGTDVDWSGCVLTIDEAYHELVVEILTTLLIMRHIAAHNL